MVKNKKKLKTESQDYLMIFKTLKQISLEISFELETVIDKNIINYMSAVNAGTTYFIKNELKLNLALKINKNSLKLN